MLSGLIAKRAVPLARQFGTSAVRRTHYDSGIMGSTLPFGIHNNYLLMVGFIVFFGTGLGAPFLIVRKNVLKAS